jgi:hypothetical protein
VQATATCWYFAQSLAASGVDIPIGIIANAIGGQRIEEFMENTTISVCTDRLGENIPWWDGQLYGQQMLPFVDTTVRGFVWYQGENNMGGVKGNAIANVGYGCMQRQLITGWRTAWSRTPNTTDPNAPFGLVTLASSGTEGGPNMGAMRWAQVSVGLAEGQEQPLGAPARRCGAACTPHVPPPSSRHSRDPAPMPEALAHSPLPAPLCARRRP